MGTLELGYKALTLFAVSVYPRVCDLARLAHGKLDFLATSMRFRYFGSKVLWTGLTQAHEHSDSLGQIHSQGESSPFFVAAATIRSLHVAKHMFPTGMKNPTEPSRTQPRGASP